MQLFSVISMQHIGTLNIALVAQSVEVASSRLRYESVSALVGYKAYQTFYPFRASRPNVSEKHRSTGSSIE